MIYSTNTWYRFRASRVDDNYHTIIDGYIVTGAEDSTLRTMEVSAVYDKNDIRTNILSVSSKCRNLISTSNGSLLSNWIGSIKLDGGKNNTSQTVRANYYSDISLDTFDKGVVVYTIALLSPNTEIATRLQNVLSQSGSSIPYLFLSAGCSVNVNERIVDFSHSKSVVFGNNVSLVLNDGTKNEDVFNNLYMRINSLERANVELQSQLSDLQSRFNTFIQQVAP